MGLCRELCGEDWAEHRDRLLLHQGVLEERVMGRARASGGINTQTQTRFCSDPEPFTSRRRAQPLFFLNFGGYKVDFFSPLLLRLSAQASCSVHVLECGESLEEQVHLPKIPLVFSFLLHSFILLYQIDEPSDLNGLLWRKEKIWK